MEDADEKQPQQSEQVCSFFRKPSKNKNIRKRTVNEVDDEELIEEGSVLHQVKKPRLADNKLYFSTGSSKSSASKESREDAKKPVFQFESSKEIQVEHDSRATATLETETEFTKDARAIRDRVLKRANKELSGKGKSVGDKKSYKGIHGYTDYKAGFRREQTIFSEKAGGAHGPLRASAHIRVSARFDYQPDICKDYKEAGYCGYGDSCKFMHDRGDYKSGWQMEKEWEEAEKARERNLAMGGDDRDDGNGEKVDDDEDEYDELPFACFICREPFVDPVVTKYKHYFCEHCALKMGKEGAQCLKHASCKEQEVLVCNKPTLGIFNTAHEIRKRIAEQGTSMTNFQAIVENALNGDNVECSEMDTTSDKFSQWLRICVAGIAADNPSATSLRGKTCLESAAKTIPSSMEHLSRAIREYADRLANKVSRPHPNSGDLFTALLSLDLPEDYLLQCYEFLSKHDAEANMFLGTTQEYRTAMLMSIMRAP